MASYSYAGLRVNVTADTRSMAREIASAATRAGQDAARQIAAPVTRAAASAGRTWAQSMAAAAKAGAQAVGRAWNAVVSAASRAASAAGTAFTRAASAAAGAVRTALARAWDGITTVAARAAGAAQRVFASGWAAVGSAVSGVLGRAWSAVTTAAGRAASAAQAAWTRFATSGAGNAIVTSFGRAWSAVSTAAGRAAAAASTAWTRVSAAGGAITTGLGRAWSAVASAAGRSAAAATTAWSRVGSAANGIVTGFGRVWSAVTTGAGRAASAVSTGFSRAWDAVTTAGVRAAEAVSSAWGRIGGSAGANLSSGLGRAFSSISSAAGKTASTMGGAFARVGTESLGAIKTGASLVVGGMAAVGGATLKAGLAYNVLTQRSRAAFTTLLGSQKAADNMLNTIKEFAKTSPFPRQEYIEMAQQMIGFGIEQKKVIGYQRNLTDAIAATGQGSQQMRELSLVMSQISAAGKITGVDLMQFAQRGINAAELIGSSMGKTAKQIKEEITAGSFDAQKALDALSQGMAKRYGGAAANLKTTWVGAMDRVKGAMRDVGGEIAKPFIDPKQGGLAINWANKLADLLRALEPNIKPLINAFTSGLAPVLSKIEPMLDRMVKWAKTTNFQNMTGQVKRLAPMITVLGLAIGGLAGSQVAGKIPVVGDALTALTGPVRAVGGVFKQFGTGIIMNLANTMTTSLTGAIGGVGSSLSGLLAPIAAVVAVFALLMISSKSFRNAVFGLMKALWNGLKPVLAALWQGLKILWSGVMAVFKAIGDQLAPVIRQLTPYLAPLGRMIAAVLVPAFRVLGWILKTIVAPVLGFVARLLAISIIAAIKTVVTMVRVLATIWTAAWNLIRAPVLALWNWVTSHWPLLLGILAGPVGLAVMLIIQHWNTVKAALALIWNGIRAAGVAVWNAIRIAATAVWNAIRVAAQAWWTWQMMVFGALRAAGVAVWNAIRWAATATWNGIRAAAQAVWTALVFIWNGIRAAALAIWGAIRAVVVGIWQAIRVSAMAIWNAIRGAVVGAWRFAVNTVRALANAMRNFLGAIWNGIAGLARAVWQRISNIVRSIWNGAVNAVRNLTGWLRNVLGNIWNAIAGIARGVWNRISNIIRGIWNGLVNAVRNATGWLRDRLRNIWDAIAGIGRAVWNRISSIVRGIWQGAVNAVRNATGWLRDRLRNIWDAIAGFARAIWNRISNIVRGIWNGFTNWVRNRTGWLRDRLSDIWNFIKSTTARMWRQITSAPHRIWDAFTNWVRNKAGWLRDRLGDAWDAIRGGARKAWEAIVRTVKRAWDGVINVVRGPVRFVVNKIINPLIAGINKLITKIGMPRIAQIKLGFEEGGPIPGGWGGGDKIHIMAEPGEWVLTKEQAKGIGYANLARLPRKSRQMRRRPDEEERRRRGGLPGYQHGGLVAMAAGARSHPGGDTDKLSFARWPGWLPDIPAAARRSWRGVLRLGKDIVAEGGKMLRFGVAETFEKFTNPLRGLLEPLSKSKELMKEYLGKLGLDILDSAIEFIRGKEEDEDFGGGGGGLPAKAREFNGHRYVWGGGANPKTGFDCSSFVNMLCGMLKLPIPGGFKAPSQAHGPTTLSWLGFGAMRNVKHGSMAGGDIYVDKTHMGVVVGKGKGFAARSTATGTGPQGVGGRYTIKRFKGENADKAAGKGKYAFSVGPGGMPKNLRGGMPALVFIARALAGMGWSPNGAAGAAGNIMQESRGDPLSAGTGGRGLIGWTPPGRLPNSAFIPGNRAQSMRRQLPLVNRFFRSNMGRWWGVAQRSNPGIAANIIMNMGERPAGSSQSNPRFGGSGTARGDIRRRTAFAVRKRMAEGGIIREPVLGVGLRSGVGYTLGENAPRVPEVVTPLLATRGGTPPDVGLGLRRAGVPDWSPLRGRGTEPGPAGPARAITINVYPQQGQDERAIAVAVSRELAWAEAGGRAR